jgi:hypothetical protein
LLPLGIHAFDEGKNPWPVLPVFWYNVPIGARKTRRAATEDEIHVDL